MSVNLMSAIFETEFRDLADADGNVTKASTAKLVLLAMADHANDEGEGAYPSVERLERKTALSAQTIRNTFDALKFNGIIELVGLSKRNTNNHTINPKCFPKAIGKEVTVLTLYPFDPQMSTVLPSNGYTSPTEPFDPNHITINKTSSADAEKIAKQKVLDSANREVDYILQTALGPKAIQDAMEKYFKMTPNWEANKTNRQWMQWAMAEGVTAAQIEHAANLWRSDKRFNGMQPSLSQIQTHWLVLRGNAEQRTEADVDGNGAVISW